MRLIIWTQDSSIQDMAANLSAVHVVVCPDSESLRAQVESVPDGELGLLVLDRDDDPEKCLELHREFGQNSNVKRFWLSAEKSTETLRQWQFQEDSPEMILSKDLGAKEWGDLIDDLNWAHQTIHGEPTEESLEEEGEEGPQMDDRVVEILKHHGAYISPEKLEEQYYLFDKESSLNQRIQEKFTTFVERVESEGGSREGEKSGLEIQQGTDDYEIETQAKETSANSLSDQSEDDLDSMTVPAMKVGNVSWQQEEENASQNDEDVMSENKKKKSQNETDDGLAFNLPLEEEDEQEAKAEPEASDSEDVLGETPEKSQDVLEEELTDELEFGVSSDDLSFEAPEEHTEVNSSSETESSESDSSSFELPEDEDDEGFEGLGFNMTGIEELNEATDSQKAAPKTEPPRESSEDSEDSEESEEPAASQFADEGALELGQNEGDDLEFSDGTEVDDGTDQSQEQESYDHGGGLDLGSEGDDEFEIDRESSKSRESEESEKEVAFDENESSSTSIDLDIDEIQSQEGGTPEMTQTEYMDGEENDEFNPEKKQTGEDQKSSADVLDFSQGQENSEDEETGEFPTPQDDQEVSQASESPEPQEESVEGSGDGTRATVVMGGDSLKDLSQQENRDGLQPRAQDEATDEIDTFQLQQEDDQAQEEGPDSSQQENTSTYTHNFEQDSKRDAKEAQGRSDSTETLGNLTGTKGTETQVGMTLEEREQGSASDKGRSEGLQVTSKDERLPSAFQEDEMARYQATIRQLREERDQLLNELENSKRDKKLTDRENTGLKAELEDLKIELNILKKRHGEEIDEMQYRVRVSEEKKQILEEKAKHYQKEFERLSQRVRMDFNKIKQREKELESQLELVSMDSESQVRSRDSKILELKRKIDQLEFNMENAQIREQKIKEDKAKMEEKLSRLMKSLKGSIELLETDSDIDQELIDRLKKA